MLLVFTLLASGAFMLSSTNLRVVNNIQLRGEAVAAVNAAVERVAEQNFINSYPEKVSVKLGKGDGRDYEVAISKPVCIRATQTYSGCSIGVFCKKWSTVWLIAGSVNDPASGTAAAVRYGIKVLLDDASKTQSCK
jgi:hypothetical protein